MEDRDLYQAILGLREPWTVERVELREAEQSVDEQLVELQSEARLARQNEITTELMDVIIAFEAMKDRRRRIEKLKQASSRPSGVDG